jgi:oligoribonuclease
MGSKLNNLVWMDIETTGFYAYEHKIIQIAVLVTDNKLNVLDEEGLVIHTKISQEEIDSISNPKVIEMHTQNGLFKKSLKSNISILDAEKIIVKYISGYVNPKESPLCGNNVAFDKRFVEYQMKELNGYLHYRILDVSSIKSFMKLLNISAYDKPEGNHEALSDIKESVNELRYYRNYLTSI